MDGYLCSDLTSYSAHFIIITQNESNLHETFNLLQTINL